MSRCHDTITHTTIQGWNIIDNPEAYTGVRVQALHQACFHSKKYRKEHEEARNNAISIDFRLKNPSSLLRKFK